ncbi:TetR family transcriptional regulator [Geodermatophilus sp. DF01-2]|uniref:TetR/AcrR family transcriptional regulator n=1 Tax=Geodermatophilus sp. DF01-2 TaxID=2559610 RepID=UPI001073EA14|nr:TetR family transcriptional regulator C-terminal domain-containing protein [Geodermatophilus sp. DF01_2]TFV55918.1 TetR family transcriptional regulator [Geodermatophilus sp. DF01_2]
MPRLIDREARERAVGEAAWRVVVREGITKLSVRNVAAEAGLAAGSLRYLFPTQEALRAYVLDLVRRNVADRIAGMRPHESIRQGVEDYFAQLLPLDTERRVETEVFLSVGVLALTDPVLRPAYERAHRDLRDGCRRILALLATDPEYRALDPDAEAARTHAFLDGLALHLVRQPPGGSTTWATEELARHLDSLR